VDHTGFTVFQYLTLRAILGVLTALAISLLIGPFDDPAPEPRCRSGRRVRADGPQSSHRPRPAPRPWAGP
jgi:phospho-N-acetylmuramoyl-pentapeptide-transferase